MSFDDLRAGQREIAFRRALEAQRLIERDGLVKAHRRMQSELRRPGFSRSPDALVDQRASNALAALLRIDREQPELRFRQRLLAGIRARSTGIEKHAADDSIAVDRHEDLGRSAVREHLL